MLDGLAPWRRSSSSTSVSPDGKAMPLTDDRLGALESPRSMPRVARNPRGLDEGRPRIVQDDNGPLTNQRFDVFRKLRPADEAVLPGDHQLRVHKSKFRAANVRLQQFR